MIRASRPVERQAPPGPEPEVFGPGGPMNRARRRVLATPDCQPFDVVGGHGRKPAPRLPANRPGPLCGRVSAGIKPPPAPAQGCPGEYQSPFAVCPGREIAAGRAAADGPSGRRQDDDDRPVARLRVRAVRKHRPQTIRASRKSDTCPGARLKPSATAVAVSTTVTTRASSLRRQSTAIKTERTRGKLAATLPEFRPSRPATSTSARPRATVAIRNGWKTVIRGWCSPSMATHPAAQPDQSP